VENQESQNQAAETEREGAEIADELEKESKEYDKLQEELQDAKDKHLRLLAEFENFRRRTAKENFETIATANAKLLGKLTEVLDNFNLAFDPKHKSDKLEDVEKGMRLIYNKFKEILSDEGLTEVDPAGEEFDPNLHDALMQQPSDSVPENHVIQVLQKGYKAKNKIPSTRKSSFPRGRRDALGLHQGLVKGAGKNKGAGKKDYERALSWVRSSAST
jgi:molecular chaperone GrpE